MIDTNYCNSDLCENKAEVYIEVSIPGTFPFISSSVRNGCYCLTCGDLFKRNAAEQGFSLSTEMTIDEVCAIIFRGLPREEF